MYVIPYLRTSDLDSDILEVWIPKIGVCNSW